MDIVTGKTCPDVGRIIWNKDFPPLIGLCPARIARIGIAQKFQRPTIFDDQALRENLILALGGPRHSWHILFWCPKPGDEAWLPRWRRR